MDGFIRKKYGNRTKRAHTRLLLYTHTEDWKETERKLSEYATT